MDSLIRRGRGGRAGVAVPLALVLLVALGLLGVGVLALAQREATTAAAATAWTRSRTVARGTVRTAVAGLAGDSVPRGPLWTPISILSGRRDGITYGAEVRTLGREWSLVTGWARERATAARAEEAAVVWSLDPLARAAAAPAVLVHGGVLVRAPDAEVEGTGLTLAGEGGSAAACAPWRPGLDTIFPWGRLAPAVSDPEPDSLRRLPALGLLHADDLGLRLPDGPTGTVTPGPAIDGDVCTPGSHNWGSPTDPEGPCGNRRAALFVAGDLVLEGGEGQGLLLVEGSLGLTGGAVFAGMVVVRDTLRLGPSARITGLVRAGGPVVLQSGSTVRGRACPAVLALAAAPGLTGVVPSGGGPWVRPF